MTLLQVVLVFLMTAITPGADVLQEPSRPQTSKEIDAEIDRIRRSPAMKPVTDILEETLLLDAQADARRQAADERMEKLSDTPEYRAAERKIRELTAQREAAWTAERAALAAAARKLYGARHAELRALAAADIAQGKSLGFGVLNYPRVDGSTSTQPLSLVIAARLLGAPYEWNYPEPTGSPWARQGTWNRFPAIPLGGGNPGNPRLHYDHDDEFEIAAARMFAKGGAPPAQERVAMMINSVLAATTNTHDAYVNLVKGKTDLVLNVRGPSPSEQALAEQKGVKLQLVPIAKDALVFIVNVENPVKTLSHDQVWQIYTDRVAFWDKVGVETGGKNQRIQPYVREPESGSRELFDALVMKGRAKPDKEPKPRLISVNMAGPFNQVTTDEWGIGYSVYYYEHFMAASPFTRTVAVDGVEPSAETIASGKYPYVTPIYAIRRADERKDSAASRLLAWLLSEEGQAVVRESGYVPIGK